MTIKVFKTNTLRRLLQYKTLSVTNAALLPPPPFFSVFLPSRLGGEMESNPHECSADNDMRCQENNMASLDFPSCLCQKVLARFRCSPQTSATLFGSCDSEDKKRETTDLCRLRKERMKEKESSSCKKN